MFDDLRDAFRQAVDNFKKELHRDDVPENVDRLLVAMRDEAAEARARVRSLEEDLARAREMAGREKEQEETCRRREAMARRIGDEDTAEVAAEYAGKHRRRAEVLEKKAAALEEELALRRSESEEMVATLKEARERRSSLSATAGRAGARDSLREADDLFAELDRMAEKITDEDRRTDAASSLDLDDLEPLDREEDLRIRMDAPPRPEPDVDARLAELKRRMGKE